MSKTWSEANGATKVQPATARALSPFALKANGTGPFMVVSHEPGVATTFRPNPNWWGKAQHNLGEVVLQTVYSDATRVAALLSGEVDLIDPVPVQDIARVSENPSTTVLTAPELRTIFLNMDSMREELLHSNVKGKNPFKDARVRRAFYQAIDIETIKTKVMRGMSAPTALMISPLLLEGAGELKRWPHDVATAKTADGRSRLPIGLRPGHGLPQRPLRQRRRDLPGRRRHAGTHRRQGEPERTAQGPVFREGRPDAEVRFLLQPAGLDPRLARQLHHPRQSGDLPRQRRQRRHLQFRRLLQSPRSTGWRARSWSRRTRSSAIVLFSRPSASCTRMPASSRLHQQKLAWGVARTVETPQRADGHVRFAWVRKQ